MLRTMVKLTLGVGAVVQTKAKFLHPSKYIRELYPNMDQQQMVVDLKVVRREKKIVTRKEQLCLVVTSDQIMNGDQHVELHAVERWFKVTKEGHPDLFFTQAQPAEVTPPEEDDNPLEEIAERSRVTPLQPDEISIARGLGPMVDDDNQPAPENVPTGGQSEESILGEWEHSGLCYRKVANGTDSKPQLKDMPTSEPTRIQLFEHLFPMKYVTEVILPATSKGMEKDLTYGEFLRFVGIWLLMATIVGPQRRDFWSKKTVNRFDGAPFRLNDLMSRNRFEEILRNLAFTKNQPPAYVDRFWQVRDILQAWKDNMFHHFIPGWVNCLDESMSFWSNMFTCPGFMFVPRKPWPFGNEYHTICCGLSGILFDLELVEGKDAPPERPAPEFESLGGKTVGLLLRLTKALWATGKVVILDSGFCVLRGIIELKKKGVFGAALIKKRRYWPKHIPGDAVKAHFEDRAIGDADAWAGEMDGVPFHVYAMKEPDYTMMLMSTYGTLNDHNGKETSRNVDGVTSKFRYSEVIHNHYKYRHLVDDHNAKRHAPISLEMTWATKTWTHRVFAFLLAITEVNTFLSERYFNGADYGDGGASILAFRKLFSGDLIFNEHLSEKEEEQIRSSERIRKKSTHDFASLPAYKKFKGALMVDADSQYPKRTCFCGRQKSRAYCPCTPGVYQCMDCCSTCLLDLG